jgi:ribonuclease Y
MSYFKWLLFFRRKASPEKPNTAIPEKAPSVSPPSQEIPAQPIAPIQAEVPSVAAEVKEEVLRATPPPQEKKRKSPELPSYLDEEGQARRILAIAMARQATKFVSHVTTARVKLTPSQLKDGMKGKIVGKDGRNARHFEERAGVDLLLNDEPDSVVLSSFDPFRREVARIALETLVRDGRIQPARIEEVLNEAKSQVDQVAREAGSRAVQELGLKDVHPAILRVLGTLKFRHSYGQNQLEHSIETAWLCGNLAVELGFDPELAKRAGLFHDLGKALDQTHDGGHAQSGAAFAKRYGEKAEVVQAIAAHHEEISPKSWLDHLVIAADALSGARPGARQGSTQNALERASDLEKIAQEVAGVTYAFAVQAGRELRVFVDSNQIKDSEMSQVAKQIVERIQSEVRFPGQIKVTVLRELRVTEVAER